MIWKCNSTTLCECRLTENPSEPRGMLNRSTRFRKHDRQAAKYYAWNFRDNIAEKRLELSSASRVKLGETWECLCSAAHSRKIYSRGSDFSGTIFLLTFHGANKSFTSFPWSREANATYHLNQALELLKLSLGRRQKVCASRLRARTFEDRQLHKSHDLVKTGIQA